MNLGSDGRDKNNVMFCPPGTRPRSLSEQASCGSSTSEATATGPGYPDGERRRQSGQRGSSLTDRRPDLSAQRRRRVRECELLFPGGQGGRDVGEQPGITR